jgi:hypothetical protein
MGRKSPNVPIPSTATATAAEVEFFEKTSKRGPDLKRFKVSLTGRPASAWNKRAAEIFAENFVRSGWYQCRDQAFIERTFRTHLHQLRNQFSIQQTIQTRGSESDDERNQALSDKRKKMSRNARRRSVRTSDVQSSTYLILMCHSSQLWKRRTDACLVRQDLKKFRPLIQSLTLDAMSGDETDHTHGQVRYAVTKLPWRSTAVKGLLKTLDLVHLSSRFSSTGRAKRGAFPHRRTLSSRIEQDATPVRGLPRNFYDPDWLHTLGKHERRALNVQDEVDLSLEPAVLK